MIYDEVFERILVIFLFAQLASIYRLKRLFSQFELTLYLVEEMTSLDVVR